MFVKTSRIETLQHEVEVEVGSESNITKTAEELSQLMRVKPELTDGVLLDHGAKNVVVFNDERLHELGNELSHQILRDQKRELYLAMIVDVANGAPLLTKHVVGIAFQGGRVTRFSIPRDEFGDFGRVLCSIRLKAPEISSDQAEAVAYLLIHRLSQL